MFYAGALDQTETMAIQQSGEPTPEENTDRRGSNASGGSATGMLYQLSFV